MADEDEQTAEGAASTDAEQPRVPGIRIISQFIRDLSFENPRAPESLRSDQGPPQMELQVELNARGRQDGLFELDLKLTAQAKREDEIAFHAEVVYGGLFGLEGAEHEIEPMLLIECPRFLFPFARRLLADLTAEGGFPPFRPDPIDFGALYMARRAQMEQQGNNGGGASA